MFFRRDGVRTAQTSEGISIPMLGKTLIKMQRNNSANQNRMYAARVDAERAVMKLPWMGEKIDGGVCYVLVRVAQLGCGGLFRRAEARGEKA